MTPPSNTTPTARERLNFVVAGHVDHGKSTVVGRLLADNGSLPIGKLEQVRALCERNAKPFEYAFLLDALKDEQAQGITIDAARVFFKTERRDYLLIDAPGHIEFLRNMVTGASRAEAALLVIDAKEGAKDNSYRHGYLLAMLGIRQIAVIINKMDLAGHSQAVYQQIVEEYGSFLHKLDIVPTCFIPVQGREGENIVHRSTAMPWYDGPTVLQAIEAFRSEAGTSEKPFRMPVQAVYKFTNSDDDRRIVAGTIESGALRVGDEVVFLPSGKKSRVKTIEGFNRPPQTFAAAGTATGFTLEEQVYVARGELATLAGQPRPQVATRLRASLFWLGQRPVTENREYLLKLGSARTPVRVERIHRVINAVDLQQSEERDRVERNEVAECTLALSRAIAFDLAEELAATSRFVLVDDYEIRGGGIVRAALADDRPKAAAPVPSVVRPEDRAQRYGQHPLLLLLCGEPASSLHLELAKSLEAQLFSNGRMVYALDAARAASAPSPVEALGRLAELAGAFLNAGAILLVPMTHPKKELLAGLRGKLAPGQVFAIGIGEGADVDADYDLVLLAPAKDSPQGFLEDGVLRIQDHLQEKGIFLGFGQR
jgi:bifunctional enzyme CysN/CysC